MFTIKNSKSLFFLICLTFGALGITNQAKAKVFRNSYVSFELPAKWDCYLENTAWVCRYTISKKCLGKESSSKICKAQRKKTREAIIILAAKEVGPKDSVKEYYNHLKTPRPIITKQGKKSESKIIHVKPVSVQKHKWVDGMHLGSEIPHYYTRYLATLKGNISVLVTFSAHKLYYTKYSADFFKAISSLRVLATKSSTVTKSQIQTNKGIYGNGVGPNLDEAFNSVDGEWEDSSKEGSGSMDFYLLFGAAVLALIGIFIWIKGRR